MLTKFSNWWYFHSELIATIASLIAIVELFLLVLAIAGFNAQIALLHDLEAQLAAHGVDWALYTPAP